MFDDYFELEEIDTAAVYRSPHEEKMFRMRLFLEWDLCPKGQRRPSTLGEVAERLHVSRVTLHTYRKDPWFVRERADRALSFSAESANVLLENLVKRALDPDAPLSAVNAATKTILDYGKAAIKDEEEFNDREAREMLSALEAAQEQLKSTLGDD